MYFCPLCFQEFFFNSGIYTTYNIKKEKNCGCDRNAMYKSSEYPLYRGLLSIRSESPDFDKKMKDIKQKRNVYLRKLKLERICK